MFFQVGNSAIFCQVGNSVPTYGTTIVPSNEQKFKKAVSFITIFTIRVLIVVINKIQNYF